MSAPVMPVTANRYGPIGMQTFGPGQNLIGQQLLPGASPDTTAARGAVSSGLAGLGTAPDRATLAGQTYGQLEAQSQPEYEKELRDVGGRAATLGRIGSGVTTSELGDVAMNRQKYLGNLREQLATQSAGQTMQDRLNQLGAAQGVLGQLSGLDQQSYGNLFGERAYQHGLSREALGDESGYDQFLGQLGGMGGASPLDAYNMGGQTGAQGAGVLSNAVQNIPNIWRMFQGGYNPGVGSSGGGGYA